MHTRLLLLFALALGVSFSNTAAQLKTVTKQKTPQTIQQPLVRSKVDVFLDVVRKARTLKDVQQAFEGAGFTKDEVLQVQKQIESTSSLKSKVDALTNAATAQANTQLAQQERQSKSQAKTLSTQLNAQRIAEVRQLTAAGARSRATQMLDPEVRCSADAPSISGVSKVTPGVEFFIDGKGFGKEPGTVDLMLAGRIYPARIERWNSCIVTAQLADNIEGFRADDQATISLRTGTGKEARAVATFSPVIDVRHESSAEYLAGGFFGASRDYYIFQYSLKNDWYVVSTTLSHYYDGHAELKGVPPVNVPNGVCHTRVHAGVAAFGKGLWSVMQTIAGPKGLPHK